MNKTKKPIYEIQKEAHEKYRVNPRTFQWYVTKGLLPRAVKKGREAFYDVNEKDTTIFDYLFTIKSLQRMYDLSIEEIKELIDKYGNQLKLLNKLLKELAEKYPSGIPLISLNWVMHKKFIEIISGEEKIDLKSIHLDNLKKEVNEEAAENGPFIIQ
jgi:DNA-binding transcriptional MerR regulator